MATIVKQLQSKAVQASQVINKHGTAYYKQLLEQNKHYVSGEPTVEKCQELSKQLFYTRLASVPGRYKALWEEVDYVKKKLLKRDDLKLEEIEDNHPFVRGDNHNDAHQQAPPRSPRHRLGSLDSTARWSPQLSPNYGSGRRSPSPGFRPRSPSPVYRPRSPSPIYRPRSPSPVYRAQSPSSIYRPRSPSSIYRPRSSSPVACQIDDEQNPSSMYRRRSPSPIYRPRSPSPIYRPESPSLINVRDGRRPTPIYMPGSPSLVYVPEGPLFNNVANFPLVYVPDGQSFNNGVSEQHASNDYVPDGSPSSAYYTPQMSWPSHLERLGSLESTARWPPSTPIPHDHHHHDYSPQTSLPSHPDTSGTLESTTRRTPSISPDDDDDEYL